MNLSKLFEMQRVLDERIIKEKGLEGQDLLPQKILALQVEVGELANEWRGFKFWSEDREPRTSKRTLTPIPFGGKGEWENKNPLLEEYVDCLHFILSIGNHIHCDNYERLHRITLLDNTTGKFNVVFKMVAELDRFFLLLDDTPYRLLLTEFIELGERLGFKWEQIEQAYIDKNAVNHTRQENGY